MRCGCWLLLAGSAVLSVRAAELQTLRGHVPSVLGSLTSTGRLPATNRLNLAICLPLRNGVGLSNLLKQIYDPANPNYRHYLTPAQFTEAFGPTEQDYQTVIAFARANHLEVTALHPNRLLLDVSGSVAEVEKTMHVTLQTYQHPTERRTFYAPASDPSLDLSLPILKISGLDNYALPRPHLKATRIVPGQNALPNAGSGPNGTYMGKDFRAAYAPDTALDGSGQVVGLLQFDGYTPADIAYYESKNSLPNVPLQNVLLDGFTGSPTGSGGEVEVSLDIEMTISMATNLSKVIVYEAGPSGSWHDILNRMANDNLARQLSCSWYIPGGGADAVADQIFQQMAAQGQSFFNASGDDDAYTGLINFPGDTPYITQVGGTTLTTTGPGGVWVSETAWNWGDGSGTGGGISTQYLIPSWQTNISMTANQGSTSRRNTPDVAFIADQVYVRADNFDHNVGGTSCAAPLWAGFAALVNQQAANSGQPAIGLINAAVDAIGSGPNYPAAFHDITAGNNTSSQSPAKFYAVSGYDLCTGWGTPAGQRLINALANPEALLIAPSTGFSALGGAGGPFSVTSQIYSLTNSGTNLLTWSLSNTSVWLTASSSSGTLTPGGPAASVTLSLNNAASNLVVGAYAATIWITNQSDHFGQGLSFALSIISPPSITLQPANQAVLAGAAAGFTVQATGGLPLAYQWRINGTNLTDSANLSGSATPNLMIGDVTAANIGSYTVVVTNFAGQITSSNAALSITPSPPVITTQPVSKIAVAGTTAQFSVAAIGSQPFSYQWIFNSNSIPGATNALLSLADVQFTNAGTYAVEITNEFGSTLSSNAILTIVNVPLIFSFSPGAAAVSNNVTITGANFSPLPADDIVYFGAVKAAVLAASVTNLVVRVPAGATYAPITVTVNGLTAFASSPFLPTFWSDASLSSSSLAAPFLLAAGSGPARVLIGDLDGDGKPDLAVLNGSDGTVDVYRNLGTNGPLAGASFAPPVVLTIAGGANSFSGLALADLVGDGRLDILVGGYSLNHVAIFQNLSSPGGLTTNSFGGEVDLAVSGYPSSIAVADLDGDGLPDIVTANQQGNTVSILKNLGGSGPISAGSFAPPVSFATGPNPWNVFIVDIDGDGKPDVVTLDQGSANHKISILRNLGVVDGITTNSFAAAVDLAGADTGETLAVGDLDGDGKPDLVAGSYTGRTIAVYRNTSVAGSITTNSFAAPVVFSIGASVHTIALGDMDGDGKPDVALVTESPSSLVLFKNLTTPGSFTASSLGPQLNFASGDNAIGVAIGDLNGDGRPEVAFGNQYDGTVEIYQNIIPLGTAPVITTQPANQTVTLGGTATFGVGATGVVPLSYQWYFDQTNLLVGATNPILTLVNAQFANAGVYSVTITNLLGSVTSSNALLAVNPLPTNIPAIFSFSPGAAVVSNNVTITGINFSPVSANDIVYFGAVQAAVLSASNTNLVVSVPVGATYAPITVTVAGLTAFAPAPFLPTFLGGASLSGSSLAAPVVINAGSGPARVLIGDLDGDGEPDLVVLKGSDGTVGVYRNLGTNGPLAATSFAPPVVLTIAGGASSVSGLALADLAGDGRLDIIVGGYSLNRIAIFQNFSSPGSLTTNSFGGEVDLAVNGYPSSIAVADLDGDGLPDIVTANQQGNTVSILKNLGSGGTISDDSFAAPVSFATGPNPWNVFIADIDGDGNPDVVTLNQGSASQKISILRNVGLMDGITTNSFAAAVDLAGVDSGETMAVGDLDGDGKPDLVAGSYTGSTIAVYRNTSVAGSITANSFAAPLVFAIGASVHTIALGDLDGDGKVDVAVVTQSPSSLVLFKNLSSPGSFTTSSLGPQLNFASGDNAIGVAIGDLNGDGRPEVAFGNQFDGTVEIYQNITPFGTAPIITAQPTNQTVNVGGTAAFDVGATGAVPLSYQWYFNQTNLLAGATNAILTLANAQLTNGGSYCVTVTNLLGSATSSNALLTVLAPPVIIAQPTNQSVAAGGTATFGVSANGATPLSYQWFFNGTNLLAGATNALLTLANIQLTNGGDYAVTVTNIFGSVTSSNALLSVLTPPVITAQPSNQTVSVGGAASFGVSATGSVPLSYQWYFNQTNLLAGATNALLTLANAQLTNAGSYAVTVTNLLGSVVSSNALLIVNPLTNIPVIVSFSPGAAAVSNNVTITGTNFGSAPANNIVYFGAVKAVVLAASPTNLLVSVPPGATYAPITVTVGSLTAFAPAPFLPTFLSGGILSTSALATPVLLTSGSNPARVQIGDLDGDGKPDLVVLNGGDGTVDVYRNLGTNGPLAVTSFAAPVVLTLAGGGNSVSGLTLADLVGDGRLDIVVGGYSLNHIAIFQNFSSPGSLTTNSFGGEVDFAVSGYPSSIAVADLDGDGKADIVTANQQGSSVSILKNLGASGTISAGSFAAPVNFATGPNPWNVFIADIDGDGKPDVVTLDQGSASHKISILRNLGVVGNITTNSFAAAVDLAGADTGETLAVGDLDGDGKPDLVAGSYSGRTIAVYRNTSVPGSITTSSFAAPVVFALGASVHTVALGDLDGDGKVDVAVVTQSPSSLVLFKNMGTPGSFTTNSLGPKLTFGAVNNAIGVAIGDLNGDGRPDVAFGNQFSGNVEIYPNIIPFAIPPAITVQPTNETVNVGATATFTVNATGTAPLIYQWYFNQTNLLAGATNALLTLANAQLTNGGSYSVTVTNLFGSATSSNAVLAVVDVLDHFLWNTVPTPRFAGAPFAVTIQALDPVNKLFTNFNGTVILSATNGLSVIPPVSSNFTQGAWTGSVTILQTATNLVLQANDGAGHKGLANPINVIAKLPLAVAQSGGSLLLSWPDAPAGFILQTSTNLAQPQWLPVTTSPLHIGNQYLALISNTSTNQFYRLLYTLP